MPEGFLPKDLFLKTEWGVVVVRDDSPTKNTLELKLSVPDLKRFLGLPEIQNELRMLTQGTMAYNQLVRALIPMIMQLKSKLSENNENL